MSLNNNNNNNNINPNVSVTHIICQLLFQVFYIY